MTWRVICSIQVIVVTLFFSLSGALFAQTQVDFYRGKQITFIIAGGPGGGYDSYARLFARFYGKHIPGNPTIVPENMEGAGGITAINYIANKAPRDGLAILAAYNSLLLQPLFDNRNILFSPLKLNWIGSIGKQSNVCLTWGTSPITSLDQTKDREITTGSTGPTSSHSIFPTILNNLLGSKFKIITGYTTTGLFLALERGEVEAICGAAYTTLTVSKPDWITDKKMHLLAQFGAIKDSELPDVPLAIDYTSDPAAKEIFKLLAYPSELGRPIVAPPGVPSDHLEVLRRAFDETMIDSEFLAESTKMKEPVDPTTGEAMTKMLSEAYSTPKAIVAKYMQLSGLSRN